MSGLWNNIVDPDGVWGDRTGQELPPEDATLPFSRINL
jgi:hypothetical protein